MFGLCVGLCLPHISQIGEDVEMPEKSQAHLVKTVAMMASTGTSVSLMMEPLEFCLHLDPVAFVRDGYPGFEEFGGTCGSPPLSNCTLFGKVITQEMQCLCVWFCEVEGETITVVTHCD